MMQDIYELIFRGLKAKYPGQPIGPHFQAVCAALDGGDGSGNFGRKVLAPELLETNKGADLRLYAMSTKKKGTR